MPETMTPEVLEALRNSIKKWKGIETENWVDKATSNCALCIHFDGVCSRCPADETEICETLYTNWLRHAARDGRDGTRANGNLEAIAAARIIREELEKLLPNSAKD